NAKLRDENAQINDFLKKSSAYAVDERLTSIPVLLVADKGVDSDAAKSMLDMLRAAGADVPGVLWLDPRWLLDDARDLKLLQAAAQSTGNAATVRADAWDAVASRVASPPVSGRRRARDVLSALGSAGFVTLTDGSAADLNRFPVRASRVLVLTGT